MDQVEFLRRETVSPHAAFHQFALAQTRETSRTHFLFFEGDDDPLFYVSFVLPSINDCPYVELMCDGRDGVLKAHELCARDGRAADRTMFFVDKDLTDFLHSGAVSSPKVFETENYSFENYIVCESVFRRFWVERLKLSVLDSRYKHHVELFCVLHNSFMKKMRLVMAYILMGRGLDGRQVFKLNLNNVRLEKVFAIDCEQRRVKWLPSGITDLLSSIGQTSCAGLSRFDARKTYAKYLMKQPPKTYVRGKYELWFFVSVLAEFTRRLADRKAAEACGMARARPVDSISHSNCLNSLAALTPCPEKLATFLADYAKRRSNQMQ